MSDTPLSLLLTCHARIRRFNSGLNQIAAHPDLRAPIVLTTAAQCARYYEQALGLHARDEDASVMPRLAPRCSAPLLDRLRREHEQIEQLIPAVVSWLRQVIDGAPPPEPLAPLAARFTGLLAAHIEAEERLLFPALAHLSPHTQAEICAEMRARRLARVSAP